MRSDDSLIEAEGLANEATRSDPDPDMSGLGVLALATAALTAGLAVSVYFAIFAYVAGALAVTFGVMARKDGRSRPLGNFAIGLAGFAMIWATVALILVFA